MTVTSFYFRFYMCVQTFITIERMIFFWANGPLKRCKANESQMKAEAIAIKHRSKKLLSFWCDVKSMKRANNKLTLKVEYASTPAVIAALFKNKFSLFCAK